MAASYSSTTSNLLLLSLTALLAFTNIPFKVTSARPPLNYKVPIESKYSKLATRLNHLDEESNNCWDSLFQLQACSGEIITFFVNGETELGHGCCEAIRTLERNCWPALLGTLGFTTKETDILEGYCDEAVHQIHLPPSLDEPTN